MSKPQKTNAVRKLEALGIRHELVSYAVDPDDLAAEHVAQKIGMPPASVYKTLLVRGDRSGPLFAVVSADSVLDLKRLAALSGDKRVELVPLSEVEPLTGYVRGGVTVLGARKSFPVYADLRIRTSARISVSAGRRGLQMLLAPEDYLTATRAQVGDIARRRSPGEVELDGESL